MLEFLGTDMTKSRFFKKTIAATVPIENSIRTLGESGSRSKGLGNAREGDVSGDGCGSF